MVGKHGDSSFRQMVTWHLQSDSDEHWYSDLYLLFIQSGTSSIEMVPFTFRVGLLTSIN